MASWACNYRFGIGNRRNLSVPWLPVLVRKVRFWFRERDLASVNGRAHPVSFSGFCIPIYEYMHTHTHVHSMHIHTRMHACMHPNKKKKNNYLVIGNYSLSPSLVPTYPIPHTNFLHKITSVNSDPALSSTRVRQYCCKFNLFFSVKHKKVFSNLIFS